MLKDVTVVVINREVETPYMTLKSLAHQTVPLDVVVVYDEGRGANWARNQGAALVQSELVIFSDNDIVWESDALEMLQATLAKHPQASYAYGWYMMEGQTYCRQPFDANLLRHTNFISTMSLLHRRDFPGFDETIERLQDWDLWLTLLAQGKTGVYCDHQIFTTSVRPGITFGQGISWEEARRKVMRKHSL